MMVAVSFSGLCSTYAIFELKHDTISQLFSLVIVYGTYLEVSQSKPLFQPGLYHFVQLFSIPARCALYSFTEAGCPCKLLSSFSPSKTPRKLFFHPQEMPIYLYIRIFVYKHIPLILIPSQWSGLTKPI